jgi:hypothetical protein
MKRQRERAGQCRSSIAGGLWKTQHNRLAKLSRSNGADKMRKPSDYERHASESGLVTIVPEILLDGTPREGEPGVIR